MAERSKRVMLYDPEKSKRVNPETLRLFQKYQIDMSIRDLSVNSIKQYNCDLMQWFIFMHDFQHNLSVTECSDEDLEEYFYWRKQKGNHVNRQKRIMSSISAFYRFLRKKKFIKESPTEFLDRPKNTQPITTQTYLTEVQVEEMRKALHDYGNKQLELYASLSLSTMARVNAIANLKWEQINWDTREFENVLEKEGKIVELSFSVLVKELLQDLKKYREENNIDDHGWIFITSYVTDKKPIGTSTLNDWCKLIGSMIGVPSLHPHDFRHSGATLLKNHGMSLEMVSSLLHHAGVDVTKKYYIKEDTSKLRKAKDEYEI